MYGDQSHDFAAVVKCLLVDQIAKSLSKMQSVKKAQNLMLTPRNTGTTPEWKDLYVIVAWSTRNFEESPPVETGA